MYFPKPIQPTTPHTQVSNQWITLSVFKPVTPMAFFFMCVRVCISMEMNTADDEPTTWLRSSLRATEVTFTPWQEMWWAINPPMHIHMRTHTHAMNNQDVLGCRLYLTRRYTLACRWGKLDHLESTRTAPFSIYLEGVHLFCPGEACQCNRCRRAESIWTVLQNTIYYRKRKNIQNTLQEIHL